jgi:pyruvate-formate lyase-activating enzyme
MGLERRMRAGGRVTLYGGDPAAVAEEWRDLARQYQSMLPDDEDPAI